MMPGYALYAGLKVIQLEFILRKCGKLGKFNLPI